VAGISGEPGGSASGKWPGLLGGVSTYLIAAVAVLFRIGGGLAFRFRDTFSIHPGCQLGQLEFLVADRAGMTGLELAPILAGEIHNPGKISLARPGSAAFWRRFLYGWDRSHAGSARSGAHQPDDRAGAGGQTGRNTPGASWLSPSLCILITLGVIGQLTTYIAGNTRLPFAIGLDRYLPVAFAKLHPRWHTPHVSILTQAILSTLFLLLTELGENLRAAYQILVDMVVIATLIPFVYIFATGFKYGQRLAGAAGALIAGIAVILSCSPPPGIASVWLFELKIIGGTLLLAAGGPRDIRAQQGRRWMKLRRIRPLSLLAG